MPLITDSQVAVRQADHFEVFEIDILVEPPQLRIYWRKSTQRRDNDGFVIGVTEVESGATIVPADVLATENPDGTKTWYENIKTLAYRLLQEDGEFPPGTVT